MQPIFIIGMPASGKTTFGRALARRLGRDFIDLDFYISQRFRMSIAEMFTRHGEELFRAREAAMLREVAQMQNVVIACGGGTPCFGSNMDCMLASGLTVCLNASAERLIQRMQLAAGRRPLVNGKSPDEMRSYIDSTLQCRRPFYARAAMQLESSHLENRADIDTTVSRFIDRATACGLLGDDAQTDS